MMGRMIKWLFGDEVKPQPLSGEELEGAMELFHDVLNLHNDYRELRPLMDISQNLCPYTMFTTGQSGLLIDSIFKGGYGDLLLSMTSRFFMLSGGEIITRRLAITLVEGLCLDGPDPDLSTLPESVRTSMPLHACRENANGDVSGDDIAEYLVSNKHLIFVLLMHIFKVVETTEEVS